MRRLEKLRRRQHGTTAADEGVVVAAKKQDEETSSSSTRRRHRSSGTHTRTGTASATGTRASHRSSSASLPLLTAVATSSTPTSTLNASSKQGSSGIKGLSKTGEIAVIVGASLGALAVIAGFILLFLVCRWRRKDRSQKRSGVSASRSAGSSAPSGAGAGAIPRRKDSYNSGTEASNGNFQAVQVDQRPYSESIYDGTLDAYTGNYDDEKYNQNGAVNGNGINGYGHGHAGSYAGPGYPHQPYQNGHPAYTHSRNGLDESLY